VTEEDGRTSVERAVIAPFDPGLTPGSEVAFKGTLRSLWRESQVDPDAREEFSLAERVVPFDWVEFWSRGERS
jgi:hypothetical protein